MKKFMRVRGKKGWFKEYERHADAARGTSHKASKAEIKEQQIKVHTMVGGGILGNFAANQPHDFYIDSRVGKLPYSRKEIYREVERLKKMMPR